jgi:hypothetical protein
MENLATQIDIRMTAIEGLNIVRTFGFGIDGREGHSARPLPVVRRSNQCVVERISNVPVGGKRAFRADVLWHASWAIPICTQADVATVATEAYPHG